MLEVPVVVFVPVVPVVHDAGKVWPAKGWPDQPGHIRVIVLPALPADCVVPQVDRLAIGNAWDAATEQDLENNWAVVAEAIQTILRREDYPQPYEALKALTRGKNGITKQSMHEFIDSLDIAAVVKKELKRISPHNYTGVRLK